MHLLNWQLVLFDSTNRFSSRDLAYKIVETTNYTRRVGLLFALRGPGAADVQLARGLLHEVPPLLVHRGPWVAAVRTHGRRLDAAVGIWPAPFLDERSFEKASVRPPSQ